MVVDFKTGCETLPRQHKKEGRSNTNTAIVTLKGDSPNQKTLLNVKQSRIHHLGSMINQTALFDSSHTVAPPQNTATDHRERYCTRIHRGHSIYTLEMCTESVIKDHCPTLNSLRVTFVRVVN